MRLIFALFQLPFWVFLAAAAGFFYLGELSHRDTLAKNQEMQRALAAPPPETVPLAEFSRAGNVGLAGEVSVLGVINPDYNYELSKKRKSSTKTRFLFVLFDATDASESKLMRGAMVLTKAEKEKFLSEYYAENSEISLGDAGLVPVTTLNGLAKQSTDLSSLVNDAFKEQNLKKSDDFIYIKPFLEGRTVGLTPTVSADEMRNYIRGAGLALAMVGLVKFVHRRRRKKAEAATAENLPDLAPAPASVVREAIAPTMAEPVPAEDFNPVDGAEPDAKVAPKRSLMPLKLLVLAGLTAVLVYSGYFAYAAIIAVIALQLFAVRRTGRILASGLGRLGLRARKKTDAETMDDVQTIMQRQDAAVSATSAKGQEGNDAGEPRRGFGISLSGLRPKTEKVTKGRNGKGQPDLKSAFEIVPENPSRGFHLSLPAIRRKPGKDADAPANPVLAARAPREKAAFRSATLFTPESGAEKLGLFDKAMLILSRLTPAERAPKALAGRPDPFERLAAEAKRSAAR